MLEPIGTLLHSYLPGCRHHVPRSAEDVAPSAFGSQGCLGRSVPARPLTLHFFYLILVSSVSLEACGAFSLSSVL